MVHKIVMDTKKILLAILRKRLVFVGGFCSKLQVGWVNVQCCVLFTGRGLVTCGWQCALVSSLQLIQRLIIFFWRAGMRILRHYCNVL
jgi:hypothetical protein